MENEMESEMQTEGIYGFKELNLSYFIGKNLSIHYIYPL